VVLVPTFSLLGQTITTKQIYEMLFLAAILTLTFLLYPAHRRFLPRIHPVLDLVPAAASVAMALYVLANFEQVIYRANSPTPKNLDDIVANQYLGTDGMLGQPLLVAATFIILFTIYGAILDYTGAGKFYVDLAFALTGRRPTGAARTVTVASFLLGTVSGSGV